MQHLLVPRQLFFLVQLKSRFATESKQQAVGRPVGIVNALQAGEGVVFDNAVFQELGQVDALGPLEETGVGAGLQLDGDVVDVHGGGGFALANAAAR